jgi:hypothetical protein
MFDRLFQFIRDGIKQAILGGIDDAQQELVHRIETQEPLVIEAEVNGRPKRKPLAK